MSGPEGAGSTAGGRSGDPVPGPFDLSDVRFGPDGLVPVVCQDAASGRVLMLAHANEEALRRTLESGRAHYYSRSRRELWRKGDTSGNHQLVGEVALDCDGDAVLYRVRAAGPACHTGRESCFYRQVPTGAAGEAAPATRSYGAFELLDRVVAQRLRDLPAGSYVTRLAERGRGYMAQKVVEEAGETIVAALEGQQAELLGESADLLFHLCVLLQESGLSLAQVSDLLVERHEDRGDASLPPGSTGTAR